MPNEQQPDHHHNVYMWFGSTPAACRPTAMPRRQWVGNLASSSAANSCRAKLLAFRPDTRIFRVVRQKLGFPKFAFRKFIRSTPASRKSVDAPK